jgi:hypothetical protein
MTSDLESSPVVRPLDEKEIDDIFNLDDHHDCEGDNEET